jgi:hypothetical protein
VANQELALARQEEARILQRQAVSRSRKSLIGTWIVLAIIIAMMLVAPALNFLARAGR